MKSKLNDAELIAEAYSNVEPLEEGLGALAGGIGRAAMGAGRAIKKAATSDTTKKIVRGAGSLAADVAAETGKVAAEVGGEGLRAAGKAVGAVADRAIDAADKGISKLAGNSEDGEHKKPDADGDGVPDWADKKPGKDDHAEEGEDSIADADMKLRNSRFHELEMAKAKAGKEDGEDDFPAADHDAPKGGIGSRSMDREELKAKIDQAKAKGDIDSGDAAQIMRQHDSDEGNEHAAPVEVDMSQNPAPESLEVSADVDVEEEPSVAIVAPSIQPSVEEEPRVNHHDDSEVKMALAELYKIEKYAFALGLMMKETKALEGWTAAKITKAADYLGSVFHKLDYDFHADATDHSDIAPEDHEGH